ncbi:hypothetical protein [uncultured Proteiniphilum sp.]|uniref:hypothetical protein n=1 Tax=uncultured Proteiniphilum sp. TaxID=497637 RepID=UPI00263033F9|nr:hypothetical protein [uncultured Proteiniphilum sp.]
MKAVTLAGCSVYREEWDKESQTIRYPGDAPSRTVVLQEVESVMCRESGVIRELIQTLEKRGRYTLDELLDWNNFFSHI